MNPLAPYVGSKDYQRLSELVMDVGIICVVEYRGMRDIATAWRHRHHNDWMWEVRARGIAYITAFSAEDFRSLCQHSNLEFFEPHDFVANRI